MTDISRWSKCWTFRRWRKISGVENEECLRTLWGKKTNILCGDLVASTVISFLWSLPSHHQATNLGKFGKKNHCFEDGIDRISLVIGIGVWICGIGGERHAYLKWRLKWNIFFCGIILPGQTHCNYSKSDSWVSR